MRKLFLKIWKKLNNVEKISRSERYATMIALKLMQMPDTELLIHPSREKFYIHAGDDQILMIINLYPAQVTLINHKFQYDIKYCQRAMNILQNKFLEVTESRRDGFEKKFLDNTENSLIYIMSNIKTK